MIWRISLLLIIAFFVAKTLQDNTTNTGISCSTSCGVEDDNLNCWEKTENYAIQQLIYAVNNLTGVEAMIDRWRENGHGPALNISNAVNDIVKRMNDLHMNSAGPLDDAHLTPIVEMAVFQVLNWTLAQNLDGDKFLYDYTCPIPCDYYFTVWMYLFICMAVILALTLVYIAVYIHRLKSQVKKRSLL